MSLSARLLAVTSLVFLCFAAQALTPDNPYSTIVDRNPFGLNPPPTAQPTNAPTPPKNVKFNGIITSGGKTRAFFTIPGKDPKDSAQYVSLEVGEHADVLEVTQIHDDIGEVEVVNSGIKMVLNFKNNGNSNPGGPAQGGIHPPVPGMTPPVAPVASSGMPVSPVYNPNGGNPGYNYNPVLSSSHSPAVFNGQSPGAGGGSPVVFDGSAFFTPVNQQPRNGNDNVTIDPAEQRRRMLENYQNQQAAFESGQTQPRTTFRPGAQDPRVYDPNGGKITYQAGVPAPPPPPGAPR